jgi:heme exporter protein A
MTYPAAFAPLAVIAEDLACTRGGRPVFAGVSFRVAGGGLLAVTGPNGAGKSSLLRILAGLLRAEAGTLRIEGGGDAATHAHYLGHQDALKPALRLGEALAFWRALYGAGEATIAAAAAAVGLVHALDLPSGVLSAGQRRRAALARLLVSPRPLWLLDEPGAGLDSDGEKLLGRLIAAQLDRGGVVIAATHQVLPVAVHATLMLSGEA